MYVTMITLIRSYVVQFNMDLSCSVFFCLFLVCYCLFFYFLWEVTNDLPYFLFLFDHFRGDLGFVGVGVFCFCFAFLALSGVVSVGLGGSTTASGSFVSLVSGTFWVGVSGFLFSAISGVSRL